MEIDVLVDEDFEGCPGTEWLWSVAEQVLVAQGAGSDAELSLVITSQEKVKRLNKDYRGKDAPTDVLSFYMMSAGREVDAESPGFITPPDGLRHLGEVIISYPQAVLQAKEHQHSVKRELAILIIHGVLHLLGYDHEEPEPGDEMRTIEKEILGQIGVD